MSQQEIDHAVKFSIEDIQESLDTLDDDGYVAALYDIVEWFTDTAIKKAESIRNAGGRGQ